VLTLKADLCLTASSLQRVRRHYMILVTHWKFCHSDERSPHLWPCCARQIHWPDRYVSLFGSRAYDANLERPDDVPFEEQLRGLDAVIRAGKVGRSQGFWAIKRYCRRRAVPGVAVLLECRHWVVSW
jgi:hypothetical protein